MSMWFLPLPSPPICGRLLRQPPVLLWLMMLLLLSGCSRGGDRAVESAGVRTCTGTPVMRDYQHAACDTLWQEQSPLTMGNGLYWLRAMTCAERMNRTQARAQAHRLGGESWQAALKQSLLVGRADPSVAERRQILDRLASLDGQIPPTLQPLVQLWRAQQTLAITLQEERARYQRLLSASETQLESLRDERQLLQARLDETQRKLENLTDIERQLSSRKQMVPEAKSLPAPAGSDASKEP